MKLQLALDLITLDEAFLILGQLQDAVDIVEVGTPWILREGMGPVRALKAAFPKLEVLADMKIMDAGDHEARIGFEAGADLVTVLGAADDATILGVVREAERFHGKVMADMIGVRDLAQRAREVDKLSVDYICVHTGFDQQAQGKNPVADLELVTGVLRRAIPAVAGGIKLATIDAVARVQPGILVVGGGITGQADPSAVARKMRRIMDGEE